MEVGGPYFILTIIAMAIGAAITITLIMARYRDPQQGDRITKWLEAMNGHKVSADADAERQIALLSGENEKLVGRIGRLEERIAVLERIVTDPGHATARAIEELR